ncbi:MAG: transposase domain protein [Verrucomicrobiales bacterium]|nr:transposase domain protein [Verrucomicrobiales bacterium]
MNVQSKYNSAISWGMSEKRKIYRSDVSDDEEWAFCASYLTLLAEDAPQRGYRLREIFNDVAVFSTYGRGIAHDAP